MPKQASIEHMISGDFKNLIHISLATLREYLHAHKTVLSLLHSVLYCFEFVY